MELQSDNLTKWSAPACPFTVEYSARILDDIRLAVIDAFFSLPRGGAEIGGLLLGRREDGRIVILDSAPVECEHAFGPSFVLSDRDHAKLAELLAATGKGESLQPVGWWHSHTRSEIFLSEADQQIHNSFFPEPWQVAVVLKPHTFQPTRAGMFFREADGALRGEASSAEIVLEPLPLRPARSAAPPKVAGASVGGPPDRGGRVIDLPAVPQPETPAEAPPPEEPVEQIAPPSFLGTPEAAPREPRRWMGWAAAAVGVTLAVVGYSTRDRWLAIAPSSAAAPAEESIALNTRDAQGELQIRWNGAAPPVRSAASGNLLILDGSSTVTVPLDGPHIQSGAFTYRRRSDRVDVTLALTEAGGKEARFATLFTGDPPPPPAAAHPAPAPVEQPPAVDSVARQELRAASAANASLKAELAKQVERNRLLEKALEELRKALQRDQQRKRLEVQSPEK